ncbi:putative low-specificity L-threonine aldolase 1 [Camellia lanceoleosa]|uniref:Low-specificity L-threonine aldolase 1 n=1 Tax=Camellia lanceoleosa TaxID=1840588 RepID=A0ACC0F6X3_9ERIC|nr:putative low-specificity L-threonine aldolase 1 [Camellia lanceoleosa]
MVCLSKGLGAPVGTVIVGSKDFITRAKTLRKTLGGGMRQVGVLCATALVAVQENVGKLESDHNNAKFLAREETRRQSEIASLRAAFTQEVAVWHKLDHPNVTKYPVYFAFEDDDINVVLADVKKNDVTGQHLATLWRGREKQVQCIRSIFHRQLSVPHSDLRPTPLAYKAWEAEQGNVLDASSSDLDGISAHVASAYQKALEMLNARVHFEEQISKKDIPDMERLQEYMAYPKFEQSFGDLPGSNSL